MANTPSVRRSVSGRWARSDGVEGKQSIHAPGSLQSPSKKFISKPPSRTLSVSKLSHHCIRGTRRITSDNINQPIFRVLMGIVVGFPFTNSFTESGLALGLSMCPVASDIALPPWFG